MIDDARLLGLRIQADAYAYTSGASSLSIRFPSWVFEGGDASMRARLHDPRVWPEIKAEMQAMIVERGFTDLSWATVANYRPDPDDERPDDGAGGHEDDWRRRAPMHSSKPRAFSS